VRTYLYVDGENFTMRAQALDREFKADQQKVNEYFARFGDVAKWFRSPFNAHQPYPAWLPEAQLDARLNTRAWTRNGVLFVRDETYWDSVGLHFAIEMNMYVHFDGDDVKKLRRQLPLERASYYASASGSDGIAKCKQSLHAIGFTPHVFQRVRPDSYAKEMAAQGITIVTRPKQLDVMLATHVLEDAQSDNFDRCIFVGGDEDYVPLLEAVRRQGKQVWLVAFERWLAPDSALRFTCDRFIAYDGMLAFRPLPQ
jgi:hypothetical protein